LPLYKEWLRHLGGVVEGFRIAIAWFKTKSLVFRVCCGFVLYFAMYWAVSSILIGNACGVYVDGEQIAVVKSEIEAKHTLNDIVKDKSDEFGGSLNVSEQVSFKGVRAQPEDLSDYEELKESLNQTLTYCASGTALVVDGEIKMALKSREQAEELLEWLKSYYPVEPDEVVGFKEKIELVETMTAEEDFLSDADVKNVIL